MNCRTLLAAALALTGCSRSFRDNLRTDAFPAPVRDQIENALKTAEDDGLNGASAGRLGEILLAYQFDEQALACFQEARQADASVAKWPYYEGLILQKWRRPVEAAEAFAAATKADPKSMTAHLRLGEALAEQGLWEESRAAFQLALAIEPKSARAHFGVARAFEETGEIDQAISSYYQACGVFPRFGEARLALSRLLAKKGDKHGAEEQLRLRAQGSEEAPRGDELVFNVLANDIGPRGLTRTAMGLIARGRPKAAIERLEAALHQDPKCLAAIVNMISAQALAGDFAKAQRFYEAARELSPMETTAHVHFGSALLRQKRYAEAVPVIRRALASPPRPVEARMLLAEALELSGDRNAAESEFRQVLRERDDFTRAARGLGLILAAKGRYDEAIPFLEQARGLQGPQGDDVTAALSRAYRATGRAALAQALSGTPAGSAQ